MEISAEKVRELREKTGAGMMDCKKALSATAGDLEKAIDNLRKEGVVKAAKKAGRATLEGLIGIHVSQNGASAALVEINCETDFVARTDQFQSFLQTSASQAVDQKPKNLEELLSSKRGASSLQTLLSEAIAKLGENMGVRRFQLLNAGSQEKIGHYLHAGAKIGVLVKLKGNALSGAQGDEMARDIAMHIAAISPRYIHRQQVPASVIEREREIAKASLELAGDLAGKPEAIVEKILSGKLNRFYSEACLVEQAFIKDPSGKKSVGDFLKEKSAGAEVVEMIRFQVGEETV